MHIPDGIVPLTVCAGGYATTAALTWYALRQINQHPDPQAGIPRASLLAAAFFVASWIHIPIPPASVHLVLNGLLGAILGFYAIPAILVGLFFQAIMFGHGGLTTLGLNATIMGVPALLAAAIFRLRLRFGSGSRISTGVAGFLAGASGLGLAALLFVLLLIATLPATLDASLERAALVALLLAHIPLMCIEGMLTAFVALFLQRVRPELLDETASAPQAVSS
jgi:cobalt/nickel transport system permease protein